MAHALELEKIMLVGLEYYGDALNIIRLKLY